MTCYGYVIVVINMLTGTGHIRRDEKEKM